MYDDRVGDETRRLASVSDAALVAEIREALIAVLWCGDAWRAVLPSTAERQDRARVELLAALREGLILAGPAASMHELAVMAAPVLNPFWPGSAGAAAALAESVEMLRVVVMHRLPHIRAARAEAAGRGATRP
ncbi:hypothetical protein [Dactylosporangium darangshiense]|uniref:TetR family transcriptional regulator n=1 Tax=Dactylosporangium darangshiense TaxID=579108 RepID=A0ABP8CWR9_9ACTN